MYTPVNPSFSLWTLYHIVYFGAMLTKCGWVSGVNLVLIYIFDWLVIMMRHLVILTLYVTFLMPSINWTSTATWHVLSTFRGSFVMV